MKKLILTTTITFFFLSTVLSQNINNNPPSQTPGDNLAKPSVVSIEIRDLTITGKVIDKDVNEPLEYATIAFFSKKENKIVTGGITDIEGNFSIKVPPGTYDI